MRSTDPSAGERTPAALGGCVGEHCAVCADEAVEGRVAALLEDGLAGVEIGASVLEVAVDLLDDVAVGDRVLVHAGVAIARLDR